ncbi:MAG: dihydroorotase [Deltaproteobacteria bacterium]|nr:dihydroorotase [Deltaproteobacteria bacterium]
MKRMLIRNGRVVDPASNVDGNFDLVIMGGRIASIKPSGEKLETPETTDAGWDIIEASGKLVIPGLIDLHVHLREPGEEYKETVESGTRAAAAGGVTTVFCMANTKPVNDSESITKFIKDRAEASGFGAVYPVGAITKGLKGETSSEFFELKASGCLAVSDDGRPVASASVMRRALEYAKGAGLVVITHAEEPTLSKGSMNEGAVSTRLGLRGIPNEAEDSMVGRDIGLAELTGARLHVAHVSTKGAVELIRAAKKRGVQVTAEATPHHLALTDDAVTLHGGYDTDAKMNPPLRSRADVDALIEGIKDGTIDCIATDHAPHSALEKDVEFDVAANGVVGLETSLGVVLTLVNSGHLTLVDVIRAMTANPAKAMGLGSGALRVGSQADVAVVDLDAEWTVEPEKFLSKGRNTPFKGWKLKGRVVTTVYNGKVVHKA